MIPSHESRGLARLEEINPRLRQSLLQRSSEVAARFPAEKEICAAENTIREALQDVSGQEAILFAGIFVYFNFSKFSLALRRRGMKTVFLSLNPANALHRSSHFDRVLHAAGDLDLFYRALSSVRFKAVHFQAWLGLHPFAEAAALVCQNPFVAEFNDLPQLFLEETEFDRVYGKQTFSRDLTGLRGVLQACDGALFNHVPAAGKILYAGADPPLHRLHFHSYPEESFFADASPAPGPPWKLAFAGTLNPSSYPSPAFGDVQFLELLKLLLPQGIFFHLFLNPYQGDLRAFWDYQYLVRSEPRCALFQGLPPDELPRSLTDYHFGSMLHLFPKESVIKKEHLAFILPSKFFAYLESGLPVLVSEELEAVAYLVREHGLGMVFARHELGSISYKLDRCDYPLLRENVRAFRAQCRMSVRITDLLALYAQAQMRHAGKIGARDNNRDMVFRVPF